MHNVLVIHTDQHHIGCMGAYGNTQIKTPNLDALAADSVRYNNSFCSFPVCTPSRYSLLSGLYVREHGGSSNHCTLSDDIPTFATLLRDAGYHTKAVGKMHFAPTYLDVGFSEMELSEQDGPGRWDDDYHRYLLLHGLIDYNDMQDQRSEYRDLAPDEYWEKSGALESNLPEKYHSTTWIGDRAVASIDKWSSDQPELLMVGFIKPHHPFDPPAPWTDMYNPDELELLPGWTDACLADDFVFHKGYFPHDKLTEATLRQVMAFYYASISQIDRQVGLIIDKLKEKGLYEQTMIVFTSDHGDYMGFHHMLLKGNHLYEPLAKVPLLIKFPEELSAGTVDDRLVNNIDIAPTILRQNGLAVPFRMKGFDLSETQTGHETIFSEGRPDCRIVMARNRRYKLIRSFEENSKSVNLFFDLEKDPLEMDNRINDPAYAAEIAKLGTAIENWKAETPYKPHHLDKAAPEVTRTCNYFDITSTDLQARYDEAFHAMD